MTLYLNGTASGSSGTDDNAFHNNVDGEIAALDEKGSPVAADLLLLEDSEDGDSKKYVQVGNLPGGSGENGLWSPLASPHAYDEEFLSGAALPSPWEESFTPSISAVNPYATVTTGDDPRHNINDYRPNWYLVQPLDTGASIYLHRAVTVGTNFGVWSRVSSALNGGVGLATGADDGTIHLTLSATDTGLPDNDNRISLLLRVQAGTPGTITFLFLKTEGGGTTLLAETNNLAAGLGPAFFDLYLHKIGTTVHAYLLNETSHCVRLGSTVYGGAALDRVSTRFAAASDPAPILGVRGFRFTESATAHPAVQWVAS